MKTKTKSAKPSKNSSLRDLAVKKGTSVKGGIGHGGGALSSIRTKQ